MCQHCYLTFFFKVHNRYRKKDYEIKIMDLVEDITDQESEHNASMAARNGIQFESEVDSDYEDDINRDSTNVSHEEIHPPVPAASNNEKLCLSESLSSLSFTPPRPKIKRSLVRLPNTVLLSINVFSP